MKEQLDRLESKMDKTIDVVTDMSLDLAKLEVHVERNAESLEVHMKRTDLSEHRIERLEKVEQWIRGAMWILMGLGGLLLGISKLIKQG